MMDLRVVETGLVPVYETEGRQVVNARELHEFLGVGKGRMNGFFAEGVTPPPFIRLGRMIRYRRDDLERWIEERKGGYK
jgi:predicted DNA-binding transcriptional regulator AlpA